MINSPVFLSLCLSLQVGCKVLHFFHMYMLGCNYFWMLCEGIYLHTLIVVAVFAEEQHLHWYYLLGWGESVYLNTVYGVVYICVLIYVFICSFPGPNHSSENSVSHNLLALYPPEPHIVCELGDDDSFTGPPVTYSSSTIFHLA